LQIGIDSFAAVISDQATGLKLTPVERMQHLLEEIELADQVGLDVFGIGEHHRAEFLDSAPAVILAAAAARTKNIRLTTCHRDPRDARRAYRSQRTRRRYSRTKGNFEKIV